MDDESNVSPIKAGMVVLAPIQIKRSAVDRLRAFEDKAFGRNAVRVNGEIERGHGSVIAMMPASDRAQHRALERLVAAEKKVSDCAAALADAEEELRAANASL